MIMADNSNQEKHSKLHNNPNSEVAQEPKQATGFSTTILTLNDDCLLELFQYLNILDIIELKRTCQRFESLVDYYILPKYSKLHFKKLPNLHIEDITQKGFDSILENIGDNIQDFYLPCELLSPRISHDKLFHTMHMCLVNLEKLRLKNLKFGRFDAIFNNWHLDYAYSPKRRNYDELKVLDLTKCQGFGNSFGECQNIEDLHLNGIYDFDGSSLRNLQNLQKLSIERCKNVRCDLVFTCLTNNFRIKWLSLRGKSLQLLSKCCGFEAAILNLKSLEYLCSDSLNDWPLDQLESLKSLKICSNVPSLKALAEKDQLEELQLIWCSEFADTKANFHRYLLSFTKIKVLRFYCTNFIEQELLLKLAKKLDLIFLVCFSIQLTDEATIQLVKLSKNLKLFEYEQATSNAIKSIIELVNGDSKRPELSFAVGSKEEEKQLLGTHGRVNILMYLPKIIYPISDKL